MKKIYGVLRRLCQDQTETNSERRLLSNIILACDRKARSVSFCLTMHLLINITEWKEWVSSWRRIRVTSIHPIVKIWVPRLWLISQINRRYSWHSLWSSWKAWLSRWHVNNYWNQWSQVTKSSECRHMHGSWRFAVKLFALLLLIKCAKRNFSIPITCHFRLYSIFNGYRLWNPM